MTTTRGFWIRAGAVVGLLVLVALGGLVLWQRGNYHQWPWQSLPDRVDHCDRSYAPGDWVRAHAVSYTHLTLPTILRV